MELWNIGQAIVKGEIDNRVKNQVTGKLWLLGERKPIILDLEGNFMNEMAGCMISFTNPRPMPVFLKGLDHLQKGQWGRSSLSANIHLSNETNPFTLKVLAPGRHSTGISMNWINHRKDMVSIKSDYYQYKLSPPHWEMSFFEEEEQNKKNTAFGVTAVLGLCEDPDEPNDGECAEMILEINDLKLEAEKLGKGKYFFPAISADSSIEYDLFIWKEIVRCLNEKTCAPWMQLWYNNCRPRWPKDVPDEELETELWALINGLAEISYFLRYTNHLSSRELYTYLLKEALQELAPCFYSSIEFHCYLSPDDCGPEAKGEGRQLYLRYYADEAFRQKWAREHPEESLPPHENPPFDRDSRLPQPEPPPPEKVVFP